MTYVNKIRTKTRACILIANDWLSSDEMTNRKIFSSFSTQKKQPIWGRKKTSMSLFFFLTGIYQLNS